MAKRTNYPWKKIQLDYESGMSQANIRNKYNIPASTLNSRLKRFNWKIGGKVYKEKIAKDVDFQKITIKKDANLEEIYEKEHKKVSLMVSAGIEEQKIADILEISLEVFRRLFYKEINTALELIETQTFSSLVRMANDRERPNVTAAKLVLDRIKQQRESLGLEMDKVISEEVNPFAEHLD